MRRRAISVADIVAAIDEANGLRRADAAAIGLHVGPALRGIVVLLADTYAPHVSHVEVARALGAPRCNVQRSARLTRARLHSDACFADWAIRVASVIERDAGGVVLEVAA